MDPISQASFGASLSMSASDKSKLTQALIIGALSGMAPDLDVFINSNEDPLLFARLFDENGIGGQGVPRSEQQLRSGRFELAIQVLATHHKVKSTLGQVAVTYGPLVYDESPTSLLSDGIGVDSQQPVAELHSLGKLFALVGRHLAA